MKLNLITLDTVKTQLGIADGTYDAQITAMLPQVSNDVRRILNNNYDVVEYATVTSDSAEFTADRTKYDGRVYVPWFQLGQVISGTGIPDDTYIQSYDRDTAVYTMSATATASATYFYPTIIISQWSAISKMIFYRISQQTTGSASVEKLKSVSYGNVSKTFADNEINSKYDYPNTLLKDLGTPNIRAV